MIDPLASTSLSLQSVDLRIREAEEKYDLLRHTVSNWCVWPLIRQKCVATLRNLPTGKSAETCEFTFVDRIILALKAIPRLIILPKVQYVIIASSLNRRTQQEDGLYKDVYFDDLLLQLDAYFKIEQADSKDFVYHSKSAFIKSDFTSTIFVLIAALLSRIIIPSHIQRAARNLIADLKQADLPCPEEHSLLRTLCLFFWSKELYIWLLRRLDPKFLFLINAYNNHAIVAAAKELGIRVIEFQHGFLSCHHTGYSWSTYAHRYKAHMPIPDQLFLYGEFWKQELEVNGFWDDELQSVGSLRVDTFRQRRFERKHVCTIVVTTQNLDTERLIAFLLQFLQIAQGKLRVCLFIKLHQNEVDRSIYEKAFGREDNVHIIAGNAAPSTFELLAFSHFHVSIYSTCHYEAIALGTPTVILPLTGHEAVLHLHCAGHALLAQTPKELFQIALQWQEIGISPEVGKHYFSADALESMKRALFIN